MTIDRAHAKRILDLVLSLDPIVDRLNEEIDLVEDHALSYKLRSEQGEIMGHAFGIMLPIERIYPDLNADLGRLYEERATKREHKGKPLEREFAVAAKAYALTAVRALHSIVKEADDWDSEEMKKLKKAIGISMGRIEVDILCHIYADHKDLDDLTEAELAASDHVFQKE